MDVHLPNAYTGPSKQKMSIRRLPRWLAAGLAAAGGLNLFIDWWSNSSRFAVRRKIEKKMLSPPVFNDRLRRRHRLFSLSHSPFRLPESTTDKPKWLSGPMMSGKSMRMQEAAHYYHQQGVPVLLFHYRTGWFEVDEEVAEEQEMRRQLDAAAGTTDDADTFPSWHRQKMFGWLVEGIGWSREASVLETCYRTFVLKQSRVERVQSRIENTLEDIFLVASKLGEKRLKDKSITDEELRRPVVLGDAVLMQDLLPFLENSKGDDRTQEGSKADKRRKRVGELLFGSPSSRPFFRAAFVSTSTGGGADAECDARLLARGGPMNGRVDVELHPTLPLDAMRSELHRLGFSPPETERIVAVCGGNVEHLDCFLREVGRPREGSVMLNAHAGLRALFGDLLACKDDVEPMKKILDRLAELPSAGMISDDYDGNGATGGLQPPAAVTVDSLPKSLRLFPRNVLFVAPDGRLFFQHESGKRAWKEMRCNGW